MTTKKLYNKTRREIEKEIEKMPVNQRPCPSPFAVFLSGDNSYEHHMDWIIDSMVWDRLGRNNVQSATTLI